MFVQNAEVTILNCLCVCAVLCTRQTASFIFLPSLSFSSSSVKTWLLSHHNVGDASYDDDALYY